VRQVKEPRREIAILQGFYQRQPVYRLAGDLNVSIKTVTRVYQRLRILMKPILAVSVKVSAAMVPRRLRPSGKG